MKAVNDERNEQATGALAGTRVVEWSAGRPGGYMGKLLRGLGAEVVLLEHSAADRVHAIDAGPVPQSALQTEVRARFLHGGKRSVRFDAAEPASVALREALLRRADILVLERPVRELEAAGMGPEDVAARHPHLVVVAITLAGLRPGARYLRAADLVVQAMAALPRGTPARVPNLEEHPPLKPGGYQADYTSGLAGANAALLGLQLRRRTGQGQLIDLSQQAVIASFMRMDIAYRTYDGGDGANIAGQTRLSPTGKFSTVWGLVPCRDGYFAFQASEQYQWDGLMRVMGDPDWAKGERFQDPIERFLYWDELEPHFIAWCMEHDKAEIFHAAQAEHVPVFPCYTIEELVQDEQQRARAFFVDLPLREHGAVVKLPNAVVHLETTPWRPSFDAPEPGADTAALARELGVEVKA